MYTYPVLLPATRRPRVRHSFVFLAFAVTVLSFIVTGCGGAVSSGHSPAAAGSPSATISGNTSVTVLATSTANDQLAAFHVEFTGIALTSKSGQTVNLVNSPVTAEFIHLNGGTEPIASVSIPQDEYTSATLTLGSAWFTCTSFVPSIGLQNSNFEDGQVPAANVSVTVPAPITVAGDTMGLAINLMVSQSAGFSNCDGGANTTFAITPTFTVTPVTVATQTTDSTNGLVRGLHGLVSAISSSASQLTVAGSDGPNLNGPSWQFITDSKTVFQGISKLSQLATGMPVDIDAAIQSDGSLLATRVEVSDTNTIDLNVFTGPANSVIASPPGFSLLGREQQGYLDKSSYYMGAYPVSFGNAAFRISASLSNLASLPFPARFDATTLVAGQNLSISSHVSSWSGSPLPVETVTLIPQTLNGTVTAISSAGSFTTYTITLAPYDLFPNLALQPGQSNSVRNPNTVVIYADSNTQMLNTDPLTVGGVFRFNGLVFNDNGTLRMDCAQVNDGVTE